jgi:hypothetical protein
MELIPILSPSYVIPLTPWQKMLSQTKNIYAIYIWLLELEQL